ncbi:hypothetical protein WMY93_005943 [Mugilogobius chulae]|uniref:Major facilitator superfamily (MFS) profile domain-containing protein n=1 Tax=Mugilogobius chulae TaxID=88201 RepID=A0AAW0PPM6_9GOBI
MGVYEKEELGFTVLSVIFLLATPSHECSIPPNTNLSQEWIQAITPAQVEQRSCRRYALDLVVNASRYGLKPGLVNTTGSEVSLQTLPLEECNDGWRYSQQYYNSTVVTEFGMVCADQWKQPLSSLIFFAGGLLGCFVCGQLSDRLGRRPVLLGSLLLQTVFSGGLAFAPSWPVFMAFFFMVGFGQASCYIVAFVLGTELLTGGTRVLFSALGLPFCFVFGSMLSPYIAYVLPNWRHLSSAMVASTIACLPFWWMIPESPRWLLSQGHKEDAEKIILSIALENQVEAPANIFCQDKLDKNFSAEKSVNSASFFDLLRTRNVRHITALLWICWLCVHLSYYGLSFITSGLYGNPFLNYFLASAIELPAYLFSWLAAARCPRRVAFVMFGVLGSVSLLLIVFTTNTYPKITLSLVLLGKFGVLAGLSSMYIHTGELFPTIIRNTAMSSCAMLGRVGASLSPYIQHLDVVSPSLPWLVVASLSLLSVLLLFFLPETFKEPLPDAIEQMAKPHSFSLIFRCCSSSKENTDRKLVSVSTVSPVPEVLSTRL